MTQGLSESFDPKSAVEHYSIHFLYQLSENTNADCQKNALLFFALFNNIIVLQSVYIT